MSSSGYYRLLNSLKQRAKGIFKDRAKRATDEEADTEIGPNQLEEVMRNQALARGGIKPQKRQ